MRPLNGKCAMTRDEYNRHRRLLDKNPFHHAMSLKVKRAWRAKHKDELNARRRQRYAEDPVYREAERRRQEEYYMRHPDAKAASWKKWADKNRAKLNARDVARSKTPDEAERRKRMVAERRERRHNDPEYAEHVRAQKRAAWQRRKHTASGRRWYMRNLLLPKWREVVAGGPDRVRKYLARCRPETRRLFVAWRTRELGLIDTTSAAKRVDESLNY